MGHKILLILFICVLGSCCKKKVCHSDGVPQLMVKFTGVPQNDTTARLYIIENGKTDSVSMRLNALYPIMVFNPISDFDDQGAPSRQFVIRHTNKSDTIRGVIVVFRDAEVSCSSGWGCGSNGKDMVTIKKLVHFSMLYKNERRPGADTLRMNW